MPQPQEQPPEPTGRTGRTGTTAPTSVLEANAAAQRAQRLADVITRLRRALRSSIRTEYPWESLPMAQVELLQTLAAAPLRVGELAGRQRLAPNTVSGLVGKLLDAGFVDRQPDPGDRRTARIALTEAGHRQLADWQRAHEQRMATALASLSPAERDLVMLALPGLERLADVLADPIDPAGATGATGAAAPAAEQPPGRRTGTANGG
ncbi:MarR family winged helix-turn-helix transcriptional regulator [Peterkaempfera bronchialis]|uniref:MarR family transcriptional regulator n=1 Tax=Peterkaempfera bronchialis TaxID=2126346 RepID=A0A345T5E2_9ACTN|nr:MarR family transcriptional regulator [Peterkaempfera bronchialis]AXI81197.1 MarR family transcriptional regulator [Peterkaempfera bronchialis]